MNRLCITWLTLALLCSGCGLFESDGEITLGKGQLPRVTQKIDWPDIDKLTGSALSGRLSTDQGTMVSGLPTSLKKGTLAHVQGLLSLAGDCRREMVEESVEDGPESALSNLAVRVTNCSGDARCEYLCGDFRGLELEAAVEIEVLDEAKAKDLSKELQQANPEAAIEAIVQIRLQFFGLSLYQTGDDDQEQDVTDKIDDMELILTETGVNQSIGEILAAEKQMAQAKVDASAKGEEFDASPWGTLPKWVKVLDARYIKDISAKTPRRFEIDPQSDLLKKLGKNIVDGESTRIRLVQRLRIKRPDLYDLRFEGAGVFVDVQPELVVSVLQLVKKLGTSAAGLD